MAKTQVLETTKTVAELTVEEMKALITQTVREILREERKVEYYVNEDGLKVFYEEEDIAPEYLAELMEDYEALQKGELRPIDKNTLLEELEEEAGGI